MIVLAATLIAFNALFVLMEFALVRARPSRIEILARKGHRRAALVQDMLARLDDYLAACQVGITIVSLALGWIGEPAIAAAMDRRFGTWFAALPPKVGHAATFGVALLILSWVHIVLGELVPRTIGIQKAEAIALWGAAPLKVFALVLRLPVRLMSASSMALLRLFGLKPAAEAEHTVTVDEMRVLLGETQEKGAMPLERLMLLENLFDFGMAKVSDAMRPREKIAYLTLAKTFDENLGVVRQKRYSRFPLCEKDDIDTVIGYVHVKELVLREGEIKGDLKHLRRDVFEIRPDETLEKLLKTMPDSGNHLAIVRDGLNRVAGMLTLEDIFEELVGEVHDEFDRPQAWSAGELFARAAVDANLPPSDRRAAITRLLQRLSALHPSLDARFAFEAVWERELKFTSAVGQGVLIPHARLPGLKEPMVAVGRYAKPAPFPTPDGVPARLVFLVLSPSEAPVVQLKVLQRIASLITNENVRRKLWRAKSDEALLEMLRTADTLLAS
jgi:CBS domain containing-hemolysin-like protein/mannitol/fructose-specific phosphotransferase system IIA component (Ntr-type)